MAFGESISGCPSLDCTLRVFDACLDVISIWVFGMLIMLIDLSWLRFPIPWFYVLHWYICLRHRHVGLLLIDRLALLSTLTLILPWLFWSPHMHTLTTVYHLVGHVDSFACILSWSSFEHDVHITICLDCHILAYFVCTWWYIWALSDCMLHDCHFSVWLHAACLCG